MMLGSTQDAYATEKFPKATIVRVNASADLKLALKEEKCDVAIMDEVVVNTTQTKKWRSQKYTFYRTAII